MGQAFYAAGLRIARRDSRRMPGVKEFESIQAIDGLTECTKAAGVGSDQEGPPPFKFIRDEALTDCEAA